MPEIVTDITVAEMTEMQRIARDTFSAAVRVCEAAGLALVPGPTHVTLYISQRRRKNRYSPIEVIDLPQIPIAK